MANYNQASIVRRPSVALQYNDPRRVDPTYPYPTIEGGVAGGAYGGGGRSPRYGKRGTSAEVDPYVSAYVPGTDPYGPDNPYGVDETALQYRGQVAGLTPEVKQSILNNATSEQQIENLIQIYGLPVVERVLREDIASGEFHSVGDVRDFMADDATFQTLSNRRQGILGNTDWMR